MEDSRTFQSNLRTGLIYDERMLLHRDEERYETGVCQIEIPERMSSIYDKFRSYGLTARCDMIGARPATQEEIKVFHDQHLVDKMTTLKSAVEESESKKVMKELRDTHDGVYFNDDTWEAAHLAAGGSIDAVDKVWRLMKGTWYEY